MTPRTSPRPAGEGPASRLPDRPSGRGSLIVDRLAAAGLRTLCQVA